ncbi:MAG: YjjG family noncanonical pyrimidine nucleotidase [Bacteroidetes bacterium]|nr:YjjG family noncanonical pyrimidine nucleotidase [Bacteroidota bacterium]MBU1717830.1 YjjG family noncanonical pyrimidine nucleotidase [Bacteroidota bacterium]
MKHYNHIFFDLDRTLYDFDRSAEETFRFLFNKHISPIQPAFDFAAFYSVYKKINDDLWDRYRKNLVTKEFLKYERFIATLNSVGIYDQELAKSIANEYVATGPMHRYIFPYTLEILEYLSGKYKIHILTNGFSEVQYKKAETTGISKFIDQFITSEEAGVNKPNVDAFVFALKKAGASPEESIMIGDDAEVDISGAAKAGMDTVWFNPLHANSEIKATYEISSLLELKEIF